MTGRFPRRAVQTLATALICTLTLGASTALAGPSLTITSGPREGSVVPSTATEVSWLVDAGATLGCTFDGSALNACPNPLRIAELADGQHVLTLTATDAGGARTIAARTWRVDSTAPLPSLAGAHAPGSTTASDTAEFTVSSSEPATMWCSLDGAAPTLCPVGSTVSYRDLAHGEHVVGLRAVDRAGNVGTIEHRWTVDLEAPVPSITGGPSAGSTYTTRAATFTISASDGPTQCSLDDAPMAPCAGDVTYGQLDDGTHTLRVRATDATGNTASATRSWIVDATPPNVTFTGIGDGARVAAPAVTFTITADADATVTCSLDGARPVACRGETTLNNLAPGIHTLEALAIDPAGNASRVARTWTNEAPPTALVDANGSNAAEVPDAADTGPTGATTASGRIAITYRRLGARLLLRSVRITRLTPGSTVRVRCIGVRRACPFRSSVSIVRGADLAITSLVRPRNGASRTGLRFTVEVTAPGRRPIVGSIRFTTAGVPIISQPR